MPLRTQQRHPYAARAQHSRGRPCEVSETGLPWVRPETAEKRHVSRPQACASARAKRAKSANATRCRCTLSPHAACAGVAGGSRSGGRLGSECGREPASQRHSFLWFWGRLEAGGRAAEGRGRALRCTAEGCSILTRASPCPRRASHLQPRLNPGCEVKQEGYAAVKPPRHGQRRQRGCRARRTARPRLRASARFKPRYRGPGRRLACGS